MDNGWIKIHRKILDNPIVCKDADHLAIWIWLLVNATHNGIDVMFHKQRIRLNPGQFITGRKEISRALSISESKVHRVLKCFESEQQIEQRTDRQCRLISITNWDVYQESEQRVNGVRTTSEQRVNNRVNNIRTTSEQRVNNVRTTSEQQSEQRTDSQCRLISTTNRDVYQESEQRLNNVRTTSEQRLNNVRTTSEQRLNNVRTTSEQRVNTKQECKNVRRYIVEANASMSDEEIRPTHQLINYDKLVSFFNSETKGMFGNVKLPLSQKRKDAIRSRIREHGKDAFAQCIRAAAQSDFLKGQNKTAWRATFDWIIRPTNFEKILSGNYDNHKQTQQHPNTNKQDNSFSTDELDAIVSAGRALANARHSG